MKRPIFIYLKQILLASAITLVICLSSSSAWAQNSDVTFETPAFTYPYDKEIKVSIIGTERFAKDVEGEATIERRRSITLVTLRIKHLPPPSGLGPAFATYVIWAITPEGNVDNIGEFRVRGNKTLDNFFGSEIKTATPHQTFSLIITAEPHYLVSSPSRLVVGTNQGSKEFRLATALNKINFSADSNLENVLVTPDAAALRDSDYPLELLEARRALDIADYYEGQTYAQDNYSRARQAFETAERAYGSKNNEAAKDSGLLAIRLAEQTRRIAVTRKKAKQLRAEISEKDDAISRLEEDVRTKSQSREDMQRQLDQEKQKRRAIEVENSQLLDKVDISRREFTLEKTTHENDLAKLSHLQDENVRLQQENEKSHRELAAVESERQVRELRSQVMSQFENHSETRGTIVVLTDDLFGTEDSTTLTPEGSNKLAVLANWLKLTKHNLFIESFTDSRGTQTTRASFTKSRAEAIANLLISKGISAERMQAFASGSNSPKGDNRTVVGRAANRRVELVINENTVNAPTTNGSNSSGLN